MSALALLLAQMAPILPDDLAASAPPTIELRAEIRADKVRIERDGKMEVRLHGSPLAEQDQRTERNREKGSSAYSDLVIRTHAYVTLADPLSLARTGTDGEEGASSEEEAKSPEATIKTGKEMP